LLVLFALLIAAPAHAQWWEAKTDHFIVYSQSTAREAKEFAEKLERFDMSLRSLQNIKSSPVTSDSHRLSVYRFGDIGDIGRLAGSQGVAGFYIPRAGGSVAFVPAREEIKSNIKSIRQRNELDSQTVLFHEYAHHFMFQHFSGAYPGWYVEGLAETYSTIDFKPDGTFHLGNPPQARAEALMGGLNFSAQRLLTNTNRPDMMDIYGRYTVGWLLTHYLTFEPSRSGQLGNYLNLINKGTDPTSAARQAFGDLGKLNGDLQRYKNKRPLPGALVKPANYRTPTVQMRRLGPDEEAIIRVQMRSKRGVDRKTAPDVASDARAIAAKFPQSHVVNLALAEAEIDAERFDQAEAAADRALALNPRSVEALLYKGRAYLERGKSDARLLAAARPWFTKANQIDPNHAGPLFYNYMTYFKAGGPVPESALIGLERAFEIAPFDAEVRMVLARQLLAEKKGKLARSVIIPFALAPHESKGAKALREVVDLIDANRVGEAYTKLAAEMERQERIAKTGKDDD
jgi:tetratricopeptide (TPR) repeat protein